MGRIKGFRQSQETKRRIAETQLIKSLVRQGLAVPNIEENCYELGDDIRIFPRPGKTVTALNKEVKEVKTNGL